MIQNVRDAGKLLFFPQKLIFCIKTSEIEHLACKYIRVVIRSAAILVGFDQGRKEGYVIVFDWFVLTCDPIIY